MTTERRRSSTPFTVAAVSGGIFLAAFAGLADRARRGADPAIGAPKPTAAQEPPKRVLVRRIVRRVIVTEPAGTAAGTGGAPASASSAPAAASAPVTTAAPPPAPVAAPAPAPAPAPVTSSS